MSRNRKQRVGLIGLGAMGSGMAQALLRAGYVVTGHDINPDAVRRFAQAGGEGAESAVDAVKNAEALIIMVLNSEQAEDILYGSGDVASHLNQGTVVLLCSTVKPAYAQELAIRLQAIGVDFLDAPVSGGTARAAEGTLTIMASGSPTAFDKVGGLLDAMAQRIFRMGDVPGQGSTMKLVNQILVGIQIAATAEAIAFGSNAGVNPDQMYEVICNSAGASWVFEDRVPHVLADDYTPRSALDIWIKDLGIILEAGVENRFPLPLSAVAHQLYVMASAAGYGQLDDAAVIKVFEKIADFKVMAGRS